MKKILMLIAFFTLFIPTVLSQWTYNDSRNLEDISRTLHNIQFENQMRERNERFDAERRRNIQYMQEFRQAILQAVPDFDQIKNSPNFHRYIQLNSSKKIFVPFIFTKKRIHHKRHVIITPRPPDQAINLLIRYKQDIKRIKSAIEDARNRKKGAAQYLGMQYSGKVFLQKDYVVAYAWFLIEKENSGVMPSFARSIVPFIGRKVQEANDMVKKFIQNGEPPGGIPN